mgnify:CR=1 FL=1
MKPFICVALSIVLCLSRPLLSQAAEIELVEATFAFDETVPVKVTGLEPDTEVIVRLDILDSLRKLNGSDNPSFWQALTARSILPDKRL